MTGAAIMYYPIVNNADPITNFSDWCHVREIFQAQNQIQFYRAGLGNPGRQPGSEYWQLEDIWHLGR